MPCLRTPSTSSNPNAFEPTIEISLKYSGVSSHHVGPCTPAFTSVPRAFSTRVPDLERLLLADVSYTTSMPPGNAIGRPSLARSTPPDHAGRLFDHRQRRRVPDHGRAELARQLGLRLEAGDDEHVDVGVQRAQDRGRAGSERARAVDHHLAARRRRVPRDRVQRHRERVGEHRELVGNVVGDLEELRVVRGHQLRVTTVGVAGGADVDAGRDRPDVERVTQAVVADFARRDTPATRRAARTTTTGSARRGRRLRGLRPRDRPRRRRRRPRARAPAAARRTPSSGCRGCGPRPSP